MTRKPTPKAVSYPEGIIKSDTSYPSRPKNIGWEGKRADAWHKKNNILHRYEFYKTKRFGWVINTLHIRNASRRQQHDGIDTARSYAISLDGQQCRVGLGPHVTERFTLYITADRLPKLQKYVDLFTRGQAGANDSRDRRSTLMMRRDRPRSWLGF